MTFPGAMRRRRGIFLAQLCDAAMEPVLLRHLLQRNRAGAWFVSLAVRMSPAQGCIRRVPWELYPPEQPVFEQSVTLCAPALQQEEISTLHC